VLFRTALPFGRAVSGIRGVRNFFIFI